ncbi:Crp/Fnr family transcriptional regulator [Oxynema sp. CENA135]|uniref:Crp/Fnr family transcriptional regulator n=1 Tax=Oxynema sp. CENA135 TaxID=984206 RepID=UPI00190D71AB|nr:Crp/Fnr family transcriptional regulator [Oxynema sp. CENA135]MBK4731215.1 Crp/Fnr family transcriptional regulator [Oxynema sp. CENA135]
MKPAESSLAELVQFLATTQLFEGLPLEDIEALAAIAVQKMYRKGEILFWEGDRGIGFFVLIRGRVKVFKQSAEGKEQILGIFATGEHFAEVPAFDGQAFPASSATLEQTHVLFFPRVAFFQLMQDRPTLAMNLLSVFARKLRRFSRAIESLSLKEVPQRLAAYLLYLNESSGDRTTMELDITKGQLAAFLGTIPETLSRVFARLVAEGAIAIDGSTITLLNRDRLIALAEGRVKLKS